MDYDEIWDREYPSEEQINQQIEDMNVEEDEEEFDDSEDDTEEWDDSVLEDIEGQEIDIMNNARIRLEMGRLYEMLIKHDLFGSVDAMPEAVDKVQSEIKTFIVERLEILLGMRQERAKEIQQVVTESPFNDMEVQALKMIAAKVTHGASVTAPTTPPKQNPLSTLGETKKKSGITPLTSKPVERKIAPIETRPVTQIVKKSVESNKLTSQFKTGKKKKLKKNASTSNKTLNTQNMSNEDVAKKEVEYFKKIKKPASQMTEMELQEANKLVAERHNRPRPIPGVNTSPVDNDTLSTHYISQHHSGTNLNNWLNNLRNFK